MDNQEKVIPVRSFIAIVEKSYAIRRPHPSYRMDVTENIVKASVSRDERSRVFFVPRKEAGTLDDKKFVIKRVKFLLGDYSNFGPPRLDKASGSSALLEFKPESDTTIDLLTSIVGLPPVFLYEDHHYIILTSDIHLILILPDVYLKFDPEGILDLGYVGYPVDGRTLFRNVRFLPGGHRVKIFSNGQMSVKSQWSLPQPPRELDWFSYISLQAECFMTALKKMNTTESFLSLTAGLDTRSIFSGLIKNGIRIPACTISGKTLSLDAMTARSLCAHYGLKHELVVLDDSFVNTLYRYVREASLLSGGLASVSQAHEVYFYSKIAHLGTCRVSGNLGNQVGRRGVERIALKGIDLSILNSQLYASIDNHKHNDWLEKGIGNDGVPDHAFLLQKEIPFSSVSNYCIGNHFALQQVPYGDGQLLENLSLMPKSETNNHKISLRRLRLRDLRHRFLGHSRSKSFQLKVISDIGGYAARYPINWGWKAAGGVSVPGLLRGVSAAIDAFAYSKDLYSRPVGHMLNAFRINGLHEYVDQRNWLSVYLKEFILDILDTSEVNNSGLFDTVKLKAILDDYHKSGTNNHKEIVFALDLALALNIFKASV